MLIVPLAFLMCTSLSAENLPRLIPDTFLASVGEKDEPLGLRDMIDAALTASGASAVEAERAAGRIGSLIDRMRGEMEPGWNPRQTAEFVLTFLHEQLFLMYDEDQTRVDRVLIDGSFNCVSSAVLYMIFARSVDIPVIGISATDHAFCAVLLPGERVDVETTNIYGFDPGKKKEFHDAFGNLTGYSYVPQSRHGERTELTEHELLALILQNRISMLESEKRYVDAVGLAVDRYALAPGDLTLEHLRREAINFAALLNERRAYQEAAGFLTTFVQYYGWDESLRTISGVLYYNQIVVLIQSEALTEAIEAIKEAAVTGWIDPGVLSGLRSQAGERLLARDLPSLTPAEGLALLGTLREKGLVSAERYLDFAVMLYSQEADEAAVRGEYLDAASSIDEAIEILGPDRRLIAAKEAYRFNFAVEVHNTFAALYNNGDYEAAYNLLDEAINKVPESGILTQDLATLKKVLPRGR